MVELAHSEPVAGIHFAVLHFCVANGIDEDVCVLGCFNGVDEVVFAGVLLAIAEDDEDFAPLFEVGHLFSRREEDGVVKSGAQIAILFGAEDGEVAVAFVEAVQGGEDCSLANTASTKATATSPSSAPKRIAI